MNLSTPFAPVRRALAGAVLLAAAAAAPAATVAFGGVADSGARAGTPFSGSFAFADVGAGFSGSVALTGFELAFAGTVYRLADADAGTVPAAFYDLGSLLGVDYVAGGATPAVQLTAGFFDASEAFFAYQDPVAGGFGSVAFRPLAIAAVPEPGALALVLAALAGAALASGRRGLSPSRQAASMSA